MQLKYVERNIINGRKAVSLIAQNDEEDVLLTKLTDCFHRGSVTLIGKEKDGTTACEAGFTIGEQSKLIV